MDTSLKQLVQNTLDKNKDAIVTVNGIEHVLPDGRSKLLIHDLDIINHFGDTAEQEPEEKAPVKRGRKPKNAATE